jgi:hypothetical protein
MGWERNGQNMMSRDNPDGTMKPEDDMSRRLGDLIKSGPENQDEAGRDFYSKQVSAMMRGVMNAEETKAKRAAEGITNSPEISTMEDIRRRMFPGVEVVPGLGRYSDEQTATAARQQLEMMRNSSSLAEADKRLQMEDKRLQLEDKRIQSDREFRTSEGEKDRQNSRQLKEMEVANRDDVIGKLQPKIFDEALKKAGGDSILANDIYEQQVARMRQAAKRAKDAVNNPGPDQQMAPGTGGNQPGNRPPLSNIDLDAEKIASIIGTLRSEDGKSFGGIPQFNKMLEAMLAKNPTPKEMEGILSSLGRPIEGVPGFDPRAALAKAYGFNRTMYNNPTPFDNTFPLSEDLSFMDGLGQAIGGFPALLGMGGGGVDENRVTLPDGTVVPLKVGERASWSDRMYNTKETKEMSRKRAEQAGKLLEMMMQQRGKAN